jgi:hypothetical protein
MEEQDQSVAKEINDVDKVNELVCATKRKIYNDIDWNENSFNVTSNGSSNLHIVEGIGNSLYLVENFVEEIAKGEIAFDEDLTKRGCVKRRNLAPFFPMMNTFLRLYSPGKVYSPHVDLFFRVCVVEYGLLGFEFSNPNAYSSIFETKEGLFFNKIIKEIFELSTHRSFKRKLYARTGAVKRGLESSAKYIDSLFDRTARLLVLRIDFSFCQSARADQSHLGLQEAQAHFFAIFKQQKR